jgi:hypothetical protein
MKRSTGVRGYVLAFIGTAAGLLLGEAILRVSHYHRETILGDLTVPVLTLLGCWIALRAGRQARALVTAILATALVIAGAIAVDEWVGLHAFRGYRVVFTSLLLVAGAVVVARALVMLVPRLRFRVGLASA